MFLSAPNIYTDLHSIWVKCAVVWAKLTQMKCTGKLSDKMRKTNGLCAQIQRIMFLSAPNIYTDLFGLNVQASGVKLPQ